MRLRRTGQRLMNLLAEFLNIDTCPAGGFECPSDGAPLFGTPTCDPRFCAMDVSSAYPNINCLPNGVAGPPTLGCLQQGDPGQDARIMDLARGITQRAGAIQNPCFWGSWTLGAGIAGAGGAAYASADELLAAAPDLIHKAGTWLYTRAARMTAGVIGAGFNRISGICRSLDGI